MIAVFILSTAQSAYALNPLSALPTQNSSVPKPTPEPVPTPNPIIHQKVKMGDFTEGGVVFWVTPDGRHGLVCSIVDMQNGLQLPWSSPARQRSYAKASANGILLGSKQDCTITTPGAINTDLIVAQNGPFDPSLNAYAAGACSAYSQGDYQDWYLPTMSELSLIHAMSSMIDEVSLAHGGTALQKNYYWSSEEINQIDAWVQAFAFNLPPLGGKNTPCYVRAVRAF